MLTTAREDWAVVRARGVAARDEPRRLGAIDQWLAALRRHHARLQVQHDGPAGGDRPAPACAASRRACSVAKRSGARYDEALAGFAGDSSSGGAPTATAMLDTSTRCSSIPTRVGHATSSWRRFMPTGSQRACTSRPSPPAVLRRALSFAARYVSAWRSGCPNARSRCRSRRR